MDKYFQRFGEVVFTIPYKRDITPNSILFMLRQHVQCSIAETFVENGALKIKIAADYREFQIIVNKIRELLKGTGVSIHTKAI